MSNMLTMLKWTSPFSHLKMFKDHFLGISAQKAHVSVVSISGFCLDFMFGKTYLLLNFTLVRGEKGKCEVILPRN